MPSATAYFARTLHGLEELSWHDIAARSKSTLLQLSHRSIEFSSTSDPSDLLELRGIEDVFVLVGKITGLSHERSSLKVIEDQVRTLSFASALVPCKTVRKFQSKILFSVTASFVGSRNYNRWELAEAVAEGLSSRLPWEYVDTRNNSFPIHDVNVRLVIEADTALIGIRLGGSPLHKRTYKQAHVEASLNPVLAYHMVRLAELEPGESLLDPMCGAGTIPIEAACAEPEAVVLALDISSEATQATIENAALANVSIAVRAGNATSTSLEADSIDAIVCDLPWGGQSELLEGSLLELSKEFTRLLKPHGRLVLLTEHPDEVRKPFDAAAYKVTSPYTISLHGKHPSILLAEKSN